MRVVNFSSLSRTTPRHVTSVAIGIIVPHRLIVWQQTFVNCCLVPSQISLIHSITQCIRPAHDCTRGWLCIHAAAWRRQLGLSVVPIISHVPFTVLLHITISPFHFVFLKNTYNPNCRRRRQACCMHAKAIAGNKIEHLPNVRKP